MPKLKDFWNGMVEMATIAIPMPFPAPASMLIAGPGLEILTSIHWTLLWKDSLGVPMLQPLQ